MSRILPKILLILTAITIAVLQISCGKNDIQNEQTAVTDALESEDTSVTENETEEVTEDNTTMPEEFTEATEIALVNYTEYTGSDGKTITAAANLANAVNGYFGSAAHENYIMTNRNMKLVYGLGGDGFNSVRTLSNTNGGIYLTDTMDTFIQMTDGKTYYAGQSTGRVNLYDQGFYCYNVHVLDQSFFSPENIVNKKVLSPNKPTAINQLKQIRTESGARAYEISDATDPYILFQNLNVSANDYDVIAITVRSTCEDEMYVYYLAGDHTALSQEQILSFRLIGDGEFHTYYINMRFRNDYTDTLSTLRFDFGAAVGQVVEITDITLIDYDEGTPNLVLDRNYYVYSDKLHEVVRFMAIGDLDRGSKIGTVTNIAANTVDKLFVMDKEGSHTSIDGVDWASAYCVGFDIKNVGVFGIILPKDRDSGTLEVKLENGKYVITQANFLAYAMTEGDEIFMGRRVYTDSAHTFDGLEYEAICERNPLQPTVSNESNVEVHFTGYDALRGAYVFEVTSGTPNFMQAYDEPDKIYSYKITFEGDNADRKIYVSADLYKNGFLECAALLDSNKQLLPVKIEVNKNFAPDGEEMFYTYNDSIAYSYATFPLVIEKAQNQSYTVCNLYERWGVFRLKQISSIRFHSAYYHLSTGTTESNCINFYLNNRLPDHRAMSMPYWADIKLDVLNANGKPTGKQVSFDMSPEHSNIGKHDYLNYTTSDGVTHVIENTGNTIDSYGPVYTDITLNYVSNDNNIIQSYRHVEFSQIDENRAYYDIDLEFVGDVDIADVRNNLSIYSMKWAAENFGYLDADNNSQIISTKPTSTQFVTLGDNCPYFDYFKYRYANKSYKDSSNAYCNLSCLIYDYDIQIGGKKYTGRLGVTEGGDAAFLTLDTDTAHFVKGDYIKIRMILMPWGYEESTDDINVRNVRINTCLNPIKIKETDGSTVDDRIITSVKSADGKQVEFTVSGGYDNLDETPGFTDKGETCLNTKIAKAYNIAVRVYGFKTNAVPKIYELADGKWVEYKVCSNAEYDGYSVFYEQDGTFSYSFNIDVSKGTDRTFRVGVSAE